MSFSIEEAASGTSAESTQPVDTASGKRAPNPRPPARMAITSGDVQILKAVFDHRFLRREHVSALTGRHAKRLHRRLFKLASHGYLKTISFPMQKFVYGLGRLGLEALAEAGEIDLGASEVRLRTSELTDLFFRHEMMIVDIHVRLSMSSTNGEVRVISWQEGPALHDSVLVLDAKGTTRLPIRPDALFVLLDSRRRDGANRIVIALEADRSTTSQTRFQEKFRAYWACIEQGHFGRRFGITGFRLLTVTLTDERARNLSTRCATLLPEGARKHFLFVALSQFLKSAEPMQGRLCHCPRTMTGELHELVPKPSGRQKET